MRKEAKESGGLFACRMLGGLIIALAIIGRHDVVPAIIAGLAGIIVALIGIFGDFLDSHSDTAH